MAMITNMISERVGTFLSRFQIIPQWIWLALVVLFLRIIFMAVVICSRRRKHPSTRQRGNRRRDGTMKTLVVLGSGGHTTEMLQLLKTLDTQERYTPLIFVVATTDDTSEKRIKAFSTAGNDDDDSKSTLQPDMIYKIPRSREVGQSYLTSIVTTLYSFPCAFYIVGQVRPNLLLCNGPGTCLPIAIATFVYRMLGIVEGNIVFVESFCRVCSLSLTGKLLYPIADMFVVHWDELHQRYPWSQTVSIFVPKKSKSE
mmetsp:Transcript_31693/g.48595  ORF Transcript_31693/g.48595 Transcript_31693/m.48595 type:complete len:256 (+) Transcript_31693:43-810(+)